jgi:hypothetical protein
VSTAGLTGAGAAAAVGWRAAPYPVRERLGLVPEPWIPDDPEGEVRLRPFRTRALGTVDVFTAVPAGYGDGAGLPVVVVLHGASASAAQLPGFGLGRFVTAAVRSGAPPFVLAGTDDGPSGWVASGDEDPARMLREELPRWLGEQGYGAPQALWGWSRGGYGALRLIVDDPGWARAAALFSPAIGDGDPVLQEVGSLTLPIGVWCGEDDGFASASQDLIDRLPVPAEVASFAPGGHTRAFWNDHTLEALGWLAGHLELTAPGS